MTSEVRSRAAGDDRQGSTIDAWGAGPARRVTAPRRCRVSRQRQIQGRSQARRAPIGAVADQGAGNVCRTDETILTLTSIESRG